MRKSLLCFLFILLSVFSRAERKYWVTFTDKNNVSFDPYAYFDKAAVDYRCSHGVSIIDSTDFPVNNDYLKTVSSLANRTTQSSRWLNGVAVYCTKAQLKKISSLPFVASVKEMNGAHSLKREKTIKVYTRSDDRLCRLLRYQTSRMKAEEFAKRRLDGRGIVIAVFDAGFPGYKTHPAFKHLIANNQIVATYDFIKGEENVDRGHWHGTATLSCIAGKMDSLNIGLATGASFLLARTEYAQREPFSEEENWLAAAEWAAKRGANIISSSIGYTDRRYFNTMMNGKNSLIARAATIAAQKGILVVSAAGNEGSDKWHFIDTPSDADSVLTVGGTNPHTDYHIDFSSFGPTSDGRLKPNVTAVADAIVAQGGAYSEQFGTSFSTPLVAGLAACAWQHKRSLTNMELFNSIEKSGHLYPYFDYAHGFGIPQADKLLSDQQEHEPTFDFVIINDEVKVVLREKYSYSLEEKSMGYSSRRNFYYKIEDATGAILRYSVLLAEQKEMLHFNVSQLSKGETLTIHFEGYTGSMDLQDDENQK